MDGGDEGERGMRKQSGERACTQNLEVRGHAVSVGLVGDDEDVNNDDGNDEYDVDDYCY